MVREETQYGSLDDDTRRNTETYRADLWASQARRVEVWCASDSVGGVLLPITSAWGVGLHSCRGRPSETFVHEAVQQHAHQGKGVTVISSAATGTPPADVSLGPLSSAVAGGVPGQGAQQAGRPIPRREVLLGRGARGGCGRTGFSCRCS